MSVGNPTQRMKANALSSDGRDSEDALKVLGRVADAFDNPSLRKMDKERLFVVNVVKSRRLLRSLSSEQRMCRDGTDGSHDWSFDSSYDEDVELVGMGDVGVWERAGSYPYASRRYRSHEPRGFSERIFGQGNGMSDVTKMLSTSSPLDRLDRLARMELKRSGWFERTDKWAVVKTGLQGAPLPMTPRKTPTKAGFRIRESWERFSSPLLSIKVLEKQTSCSSRRSESDGHDAVECDRHHKFSTPRSIRSSVRSDSYLVDFSTLSYADTPIRASRLSRTLLHRPRTRGGFGHVVRDFVKRMLAPSSGWGVRGAPGTGSDASGWTLASESSTSSERV